MNKKLIIKHCKLLGCCEACCLRYIGLKNPDAYENSKQYILKLQDVDNKSETNIESEIKIESGSVTETEGSCPIQKVDTEIESIPLIKENVSEETNGTPPAKKQKVDGVCVSCMGVLQEETWPESFKMVKDMLDKKCYECQSFACALSAPIATLLREKAITLRLCDAFKEYDPRVLTPLKEAWKWSFGVQLAAHINMTLDSGAISPLLITLNMEYPDDLQELEILKTLSPNLFESRSKQKKRFTVEFTRRSVEQALDGVTLEALQGVVQWSAGLPAVYSRATCVSVVCTHAPVYLGGRYIKLSRELPQTPWLVGGKRMMESSVQEIIFEPIASLYQMQPEEMEHRLKFISAGREDVDVRCLGDGRPFAIEITDPKRELNVEELLKACELISSGGKVVVKRLVPVTREDLTQLKKGEETKCKTYEALCIKLSHSEGDAAANGNTPITVTPQDIENINTYRNTPEGDPARVVLTQRTPIRVLHRRPLLSRSRKILELSAEAVPDAPQLLVVRVRTEAGTYVKEWAHGELRRTRPALHHALRAPADILALDVASVDLDWPTHTDTQ